MSKQPKAKEVDPTEIPAVADFINARDKLNEFKEENAAVFEVFDELVAEYNTALEKAEKLVRADEVTCGPFVLYQWQTKYDAEKLYDSVGRDEFLRLGGQVKTVPEYSLDKSTFEAKMAQNAVPPPVLNVVVRISPRYKTPDKLIT